MLSLNCASRTCFGPTRRGKESRWRTPARDVSVVSRRPRLHKKKDLEMFTWVENWSGRIKTLHFHTLITQVEVTTWLRGPSHSQVLTLYTLVR